REPMTSAFEPKGAVWACPINMQIGSASDEKQKSIHRRVAVRWSGATRSAETRFATGIDVMVVAMVSTGDRRGEAGAAPERRIRMGSQHSAQASGMSALDRARPTGFEPVTFGFVD